MACSAALRRLLLPTKAHRLSPPPPNPKGLLLPLMHSSTNPSSLSIRKKWLIPVKSSPESESESDSGVSLGTMKLPLDTDIPRFETLLFQWANSLCQGANIPLPLPLKIDRIHGGLRLGFVLIDDGKTDVPVYIDCLVIPGSGDSGPIFRAIRNGAKKGEAPPGEPRIMKSLLAALKKSVEIARV